MNSVDEMLGAFDWVDLVPASMPQARAFVRTALCTFLQNLPARRLEQLEALQRGIPSGAPPAVRLLALLQHCPTLHKFGQLLARRRDLPPALRTVLQSLESLPPTASADEVRERISREVARFASEWTFDPAGPPLAEASVAVVVPVTIRRGGEAAPLEAVVKLLKPDITENLMVELNALAAVADALERDGPAAGLPDIRYRDTFEDVRALVTHEVNLVAEHENLAAAFTRLALNTNVLIPEPLACSSAQMLAMGRIHGRKVTDAPADAGTRRRLGRTIVQALIADVLFSPDEVAHFHADPHAGNLFVTDDGRLAILDWSLVGCLGRSERRAVVLLLAAALTLDAPLARRAIETLAIEPPPAAISPIIDAAIDRVARGQLPGLDWMVALLDGLATTGVRFSADMLLMRKCLWLLEGVLADLSPDVPVDATLIAAAFSAFAFDWPHRLMSGPFAAAPRTHLSNADLAALALRLPVAAVNFWQRFGGAELPAAAPAR